MGRMRIVRATLHVAVLLGLTVTTTAGAADVKRVLTLHSSGPDFGDAYAKDLRAELDRELPGRIQFYESWLVAARSPATDAPLVNYLRASFADQPPDLIIAIGAPAASFVRQDLRPLYPSTPALLTQMDQRRIAPWSLTPNDASVPLAISLPIVAENILRVLPQTTHIAVVIGNSPLERYWMGQIRESWQPFKDRVSLIFLSEPSFDGVLKRVATLPRDSAIFVALLTPEMPGIPRDEQATIAKLHQAANAPMFSYMDAYLGSGIVGGPMISGQELTHTAATVAVRLLRGERGQDLRLAPIGLGNPQFDWRELRRWQIDVAQLPPGSVIRFRQPSVWERFHQQILSAIALILFQATLIAALLHERRRRRLAEIQAHQRITELAHMNRQAAVGELSASLAHELSQPLTAIQSNAEAARLILGSARPDLAELGEILDDIERDQERAGEVIRRLRQLLAKTPLKIEIVDLNQLIREVLAFVSAQALAHRVTLHPSLSARPLPVSGDRTQLQQIVLNLVMNGIEAVAGREGERRITVRSALTEDRCAIVGVADSGPGILVSPLQLIFEPSFSTKKAGLGMGLAISRTIIERHGGRIWVENQESGGAIVRFSVPLVAREAA